MLQVRPCTSALFLVASRGQRAWLQVCTEACGCTSFFLLFHGLSEHFHDEFMASFPSFKHFYRECDAHLINDGLSRGRKEDAAGCDPSLMSGFRTPGWPSGQVPPWAERGTCMCVLNRINTQKLMDGSEEIKYISNSIFWSSDQLPPRWLELDST